MHLIVLLPTVYVELYVDFLAVFRSCHLYIHIVFYKEMILMIHIWKGIYVKFCIKKIQNRQQTEDMSCCSYSIESIMHADT